MDISQLNSNQLRQALTLLEKRKRLTAEIVALDHAFEKLAGGGTVSANDLGPRPASRARAKVSSRRGAVKEAILKELKAAGKDGVRVVELAAKLGLKTGNVHTWFNTTGRNVTGLRKIGPARYRLEA